MDWQKAIVIITMFMFYEYVNQYVADKYSPDSSGSWLIPFIGSVTLNEQNIVQWQKTLQSVTKSIYCLLLSIDLYLLYLFSQNHLLGLATTVLAVLSLVGLFPMYSKQLLKTRNNSFKSFLLSTKNNWVTLVIMGGSVSLFMVSTRYGWHLLNCLTGIVSMLYLANEYKNDNKVRDDSQTLQKVFLFKSSIAVFLLIILLMINGS